MKRPFPRAALHPKYSGDKPPFAFKTNRTSTVDEILRRGYCISQPTDSKGLITDRYCKKHYDVSSPEIMDVELPLTNMWEFESGCFAAPTWPDDPTGPDLFRLQMPTGPDLRLEMPSR